MRASKVYLVYLLICLIALISGCDDKGTDSNESPPQDTTPPPAITTLKAEYLADRTMTLTWIAPEDDESTGQITNYDIRYSTSLLNEAGWAQATKFDSIPSPGLPGSHETISMFDDAFREGRSVYFAIKAGNAAGNWSGLSNVVGFDSLELDTVPPSRILNLTVQETGLDYVTLRWSAVGDDGFAGVASEYDLRYASEPINDDNFLTAKRVVGVPDPLPAGNFHEYTIDNLQPRSTYYISIRVSDNMGNISELSPTLSATTLGPLSIVWTGTINTPNRSEARVVVISHIDGFVIGGLKYYDDFDYPQTYAAEISSSNIVSWQYEAHIPAGADSVTGLAAHLDGFYYLIGTGQGYQVNEAYLVQLDQTGNEVNGEVLTSWGLEHTGPLVGPAPYLLFSLWTFARAGYSQQYAALVQVVFDQTIYTDRSYHIESSCPDAPDGWSRGDDLILTFDTHGLLIAWTAEYYPEWDSTTGCGPSVTNCFLTCVDDRLTTIWEKPFGTNGTKVEALLAVNNNRYAALIWTSDGQHLILLDDAGNLIDDLQVSGNTNDGYYGLGLTNQGNIIMAGSFEDRGKVLVTDLNGVVLDSVVNSSSTKEKLAALAVASSGDIMAVGWKENQTGIRQILLVKIRTSY